MRGRLRLSKTPGHVPKTSLSAGGTAVPSTRFGLWADVQRHLLQAYEYLCHVGEAQQWIEGCLGEELGFGVVEMDNGLQNGVVLAKLARVFGADVKKIREERGHSWYHMENITAFLKFVRDLGLPECFIFEPTDLYDKKNIPKVIFCIHALSHFLARRGMAQRMGNLLGRLQFSDDQLRQTQKGLKDAGVPMPNFSSVGRELAREINEEPEETEEDRRDRMLLEVEDSIVAVQTLARRFLARKAHAARLLRLRIAERSIAGLQARSRGVLARQSIIQQRKTTADLAPWARALQAMARGIQAQARGVLQRRRFARLRAALRTSKASFIKLQALARAKVVRTSHVQLSKTFAQPHLATSVVGIQSAARGLLRRQQAKKQLAVLTGFVAPRMVGLQAHVRGVLVRRHVRAQLAKLDDVTEIVVRIQAAAGAFLARRRLLMLIRGLRSVVPVVTGLQARARAKLLRQKQQNVVKKLEDVQVVKSVGGFQALARAAIARNRGREQLKKLEFVEPDVRGFQAVCRGALVRDEFWAWRRYLHESQEEATYLQKLLRGLTVRKEFHAKLAYYRANLDKVVKIQALFRAKETREQYRQLAVGKNVTVGTIKNFVHLLDDSEKDFEDEIELERRRKKIVELVREVQNLENEVADLDVKIALVVNNVKSFETTRKTTHASRPSLAAHGDPFAGPSSLDASTRRKLELYQQLFYLLQTHGDYFARLFYVLSRAELPDKTKRLAERVILTLYGFGQDRREEYLLLKMLQAAAIEEIRTAPSVRDLLAGNPMYINVAVQYIRPKQVSFVKEALQHMVRLVVDETELDLETDPVAIYLARINIEEMQSGVVSKKSKNVGFHQAVDDPETRQEFIHHLQKLHALTKDFVHVITQSTRRMPYGMRCLARESLQTLKHYFPNETDDTYAAFIGRLIYYRYLHPAILAPETFDLVPNTIGSVARKNLSEISKMLMQICSGAIFGQENPCLMPLNSYVEEAIVQMNGWFFEVADVPEPEAFFHAHEFLDVTVQPRPIYISPNEVYSMHTLLIQNLDRLTQSKEDPLRIIITELDGVPHLASDELRDARDRAVTLELTNRFANVEDPHAEEKALWVQAKRGVLAILRVQPSNDLYDSLLQDVTEEHEGVWADIVDQQVAANKLVAERVHPRNRREPSTMANEGGTYRLEDIQSLSFHEVKIRAISYLLELEKLGKVTRNDSYQAILNAIASDVRSKHRKRIQRDMEIEGLGESRKYLEERKKQFQEQIKSYNSYVNNTMSTMHGGKGKKRFVMPFSKQFFHQRDAQRSGRSAQFGTFKYSAQDLYDKGILLSMDQFSPRQFDRIDIVLSSNKMHVFTFEIYNNGMSSSILVGETELRMEDLLQAQFENRISLALFDGMVKVHVNLLLFQINKKYVQLQCCGSVVMLTEMSPPQILRMIPCFRRTFVIIWPLPLPRISLPLLHSHLHHLFSAGYIHTTLGLYRLFVLGASPHPWLASSRLIPIAVSLRKVSCMDLSPSRPTNDATKNVFLKCTLFLSFADRKVQAVLTAGHGE
ncbi:hypothetical protein BKA62DRAFT_619136 [Auriculariales sp. MPI-PUGE-AT-0066]|nr:hypothetical protein BKA62DRAFT_619136 [Auriculariales sp. MPI-PUGE-AT-0066]